MKKADIEAGEQYEVPAPSEFDGRRARGVKATVVEVGVPRPHSTRLDGVLVRLEEECSESRLMKERVLREVGYEYVVPTAHVIGRWEQEQEVKLVARARCREEAEKLEAALDALGLDRGVEPPRFGHEGEGRPGFRVQGANKQVVIDIPAMLAWLDGDIGSKHAVAVRAIAEFVDAVKADVPWTGLADIAEPDMQRFRDAAVRKVTGADE